MAREARALQIAKDMILKAKYRSLLTVFALLTFDSAPASANYDVNCMERLTKAPAEVNAFEKIRGAWSANFVFLKVTRPVSHIEHEAFMDFTHGLPLLGLFADGSRQVFRGEAASIAIFGQALNKTELIAVSYLPESLKNLGAIYKQACVLLGRKNCDVYDDYPGLSSAVPRPFTPVEEQALKWCAFHLISLKGMASTMWSQRNSGRPEEQIILVHQTAEKFRTEDARQLLAATFPKTDSEIVFEQMIQPYIQATFARTLEIFKGNLSH